MLRTLAMCAAIGAAAVTVRAAELPRETADCHIYKIWQFDTSVEGWVADRNLSRFTLKDGILSFPRKPDLLRDLQVPDQRADGCSSPGIR